MQLTVLFKVFRRKLEWPFTYQSMRVMKMTAFILLAACLQVTANSEAQTVTLSKKNATLKSIFAEIRKQTGYDFFYEEKVIKEARRVNIEVTNASIEEALDICLDKQGISYMITGTTVVLKRKDVLKVNIDPVAILQFDSIPRVRIIGRVQMLDSSGVFLENVNIINRNTGQSTTTDANGIFGLLAGKGDILDFSYVGLKNHRFRVSSTDKALLVNLERDIKVQEAVVVYNTGYEHLPKERATGSFEFVNKEELNRRVGTDILSRLEGVANSVFLDRRTQQPFQSTVTPNNLIIRGISTLTPSMQSPLIILNNFPYDGDINNINPNDVESITILKDAAAASIWGAKAANGVIVITTRVGKYNQKTKLFINSNINIIERPNLFHYPRMSSSEFIDLEIFLFNKGFYDGNIGNTFTWPALTPVVEILENRRTGKIAPSDSASLIDNLRTLDVRNDFNKYVYRASVNQQYALNLTGGNEKITYSFSGGFDKNLESLVGNNFQRITLRSSNTFSPFNNLEIDLGLAYSQNSLGNNSLGSFGGSLYDYLPGYKLYPYAQFADVDGDVLSIPHDYRVGFTDTAGAGLLLDWKFRPLDEIRYTDNSYKLQDLTLNIGANYKVTAYLT